MNRLIEDESFCELMLSLLTNLKNRCERVEVVNFIDLNLGSFHDLISLLVYSGLLIAWEENDQVFAAANDELILDRLLEVCTSKSSVSTQFFCP